MTRKCFICNGTGAMCNVCGEAENACDCDEEEQSLRDCEDCGGTGVASADKAEDAKEQEVVDDD